MPDRGERIYASYDMQDPRRRRLEKSYSRTTSVLGEITVPAGFAWDGASIPRILHGILPTWGAHVGAALIHDYLYNTKPCTREQADRAFLELLIEDGVPAGTRATVLYRAVQVARSGPLGRRMSMIQQAMEHVPKWLLPSVVVMVLGLAFWNQNNETRFVVLEQATARNEERIASAVLLIGRIEQGLIHDRRAAPRRGYGSHRPDPGADHRGFRAADRGDQGEDRARSSGIWRRRTRARRPPGDACQGASSDPPPRWCRPAAPASRRARPCRIIGRRRHRHAARQDLGQRCKPGRQLGLGLDNLARRAVRAGEHHAAAVRARDFSIKPRAILVI